MTITEFLQARISEDERSAEAGGYHNGRGVFANDNYGCLLVQPARVLAECAAKRAIMDASREDHEDSLTRNDDTIELATIALYALAAVYKDHDDYQEAWAV
ncbi:DUF6221 family protein [Paenarthrobacter nicotinovorans]|uniref:DUF6221 family protein n=1 Tax=Paenarthrobacter nicotinovorans TaxID=29320 RepID=UPI0038140508